MALQSSHRVLFARAICPDEDKLSSKSHSRSKNVFGLYGKSNEHYVSSRRRQELAGLQDPIFGIAGGTNPPRDPKSGVKLRTLISGNGPCAVFGGVEGRDNSSRIVGNSYLGITSGVLVIS